MTTDAIVLVVVAVLLAGVVCLGIQILRRLSQVQSDASADAAAARRGVESAVAALMKPGPRFDSPVTRLTFQESLDRDRFAEASRASATGGLTDLLASHVADGVVVTVQSVRLLQQGAEMIVSASASGRQLLTEGRALIPLHGATGMRLPLLTDARTGKVIEQLKEMPVSTVTSKLTSISNLVIGAAHLVAGADLAKRLQRVDAKLNLLLATRRIDQIARLERIYMAARELGSRQLDVHRRLELWRLRGELRELRSAWRQEFRLRLELVEDPANAPWFQRLFSTQRSVDRRVSGDISEGEAEVALIEYSIRLEHVLAIGSDTLEEFQHSQESELEQLDQLRDRLQEKASYISGKHPHLSVDPVVKALSEVVTAHRDLLPRSIQPDANVIDVQASV